MSSKQQSTSLKRNQANCYFLAASTAAILSVASCIPKPAVTEGTKTFTAEHLAAGKTIYENSCGRCHELPNPTAHSAQDWVGIMNWMAPKAKLTDEQHAFVYDYVVSVKK